MRIILFQFLEAFMLTQMFDKFIEEREDPTKLRTVSEGKGSVL